MPRRSLSRERVVEEAWKLIDETAVHKFSLRGLAAHLDVQVSSLYNHIPNEEALLTEVGLRTVDHIAEFVEKAIDGKTGDEALFALGDAYRGYANAHPGHYGLVLGASRLRIPAVESAATKVVRPILQVLSQYGITGGDLQIHFLRMLRSAMCGFVIYEQCGSFVGVNVSKDETYHFMLQSIANELRAQAQNQ